MTRIISVNGHGVVNPATWAFGEVLKFHRTARLEEALRKHYLGETISRDGRFGAGRNELCLGTAGQICELPNEDTLAVRVQVHSH